MLINQIFPKKKKQEKIKTHTALHKAHWASCFFFQLASSFLHSFVLRMKKKKKNLFQF